MKTDFFEGEIKELKYGPRTICYHLNGVPFYFYLKPIHWIFGFKSTDGIISRKNKLGFTIFRIKPIRVNTTGDK